MPIESHSERDILISCIDLMQDLCNSFDEYLTRVGVYPQNEEEAFSYNLSMMRLVRKLFLRETNHAGGRSVIYKCQELGVDWETDMCFRCGLKNKKSEVDINVCSKTKES